MWTLLTGSGSQGSPWLLAGSDSDNQLGAHRAHPGRAGLGDTHSQTDSPLSLAGTWCQGTGPGRSEDKAAHKVRVPVPLHSLCTGRNCSDKGDSAGGPQDKACLRQRGEDGCTPGSGGIAPGTCRRETTVPKGSRLHPLGTQWS